MYLMRTYMLVRMPWVYGSRGVRIGYACPKMLLLTFVSASPLAENEPTVKY